MGTFSVTYQGNDYTVTTRAVHIVLNDNDSLRRLTVVGARPTIGGEEQRTHSLTQQRAVQILTGAGYSMAQINGLRDMLLALIEEGILDGFDDARQGGS